MKQINTLLLVPDAMTSFLKGAIKFIIFLVFILAGICLTAQNNYTQFVDPMIGTGAHGHTFPGATTPFAMVQLSPDTRIDGSWDGCSGYHYSDSVIYGFSHTHLSGTGCSDYGDIGFMPSFAKMSGHSVSEQDVPNATFYHKNEISNAGYYSVLLNNGIKVELTATTRVGLQQYTYMKSGYAWITLDLKHRDSLLEGRIKTLSKNTFSGFRRSEAWAKDQLVYFYFEVNKEAEQVIVSTNEHGETKLNLGYHVMAGDKIMVKTALSSADEAGAKNNMDKELPSWDFAKTKYDAQVSWNQELNRIKAYGGTKEEKTNFYTALYHCMIHPNIMNDVDGRYRGRDHQIHTTDGFNYYTVFSVWDTYRALHPLLNIIDIKRSRDFVLTFKAQFEQSGRLPMWELWGNETNCMIGFHSVSVILDAYQKGAIGSEALNALYQAVKTEAMSTRFGLSSFRMNGFLSIEDESESVSKTLEYSYDMHCVAQMAYLTHHEEDATYFGKLAGAWKNVYDVQTGLMRPRKNGGWLSPFDPKQVNNHYTEANAWQYSFAVPQEYWKIYDKNKLSELFNTDSKTTGRDQSDITGMIGQYAHGNEPSHHIPYLFNDIDSTSKYVKEVCSTLYKPTPEGLCGNEDCGQMSAWYVFSAMGFYPMNPSSNEMVYGNMLFDSVRFTSHESTSILYKYKKPISGINYVKSNNFFLWRGDGNYYYGMASISDRDGPIPRVELSAPVIESNQEVFDGQMKFTLRSNNLKNLNEWVAQALTRGNIYYTLDATLPTAKSSQYKYGDTLVISESMVVKAIFIADSGAESAVATAKFYKKPNPYSIFIRGAANKQYTADGEEALLDGLAGSIDWRKGRWQGYQSQDFEAVINLKELLPIHGISVGFLQDSRYWILFPTRVVFYGSTDSVHFEEIGTVINEVPENNVSVQRKEFELHDIEKNYHYIRVKAFNYGKLPSWHQGFGGDAFIFVDEVTIR